MKVTKKKEKSNDYMITDLLFGVTYIFKSMLTLTVLNSSLTQVFANPLKPLLNTTIQFSHGVVLGSNMQLTQSCNVVMSWYVQQHDTLLTGLNVKLKLYLPTCLNKCLNMTHSFIHLVKAFCHVHCTLAHNPSDCVLFTVCVCVYLL